MAGTTLGGAMSARSIRELVERNPLLQGIGKREVAKLHDDATEVVFAEGETITRSGMIGSDVFLVLRGAAEVRRDGEAIARLESGDFFGELSVLTGAPRSADVVATDRLVALRLSADTFRETLERHGKIAYRVLETATRRLHGAGDVVS